MIRPRPWSQRPPSAEHTGWDKLWSQLIEVTECGGGRDGSIDDRSYELLRQAGIFGAIVPPQHGGAGLDPLDALTLIEDLSSVSGTLGWIAFVGVTGGMFSIELPAPGAREVYADPNRLVAYAGGINGVLTQRGDELTVSGSWHMATGLSHADWIAVGCASAADPTATAVALLPRSECEIGPYWTPVGLPGTGTGPISVRDAVVPAYRVAHDIKTDPENRRRRRLRVLIPSAIAAVSVGIGLGALDDVASQLAGEQPTHAGERRADSELIQDQLGRHYAQMLAARSLLHEVTTDAWRRACGGGELGLELAARHRLAATHVAHVAADVAGATSQLAGVGAVTSGHQASIRWLDARTIIANITVRDLYYQVYGGALSGGAIPKSWP